MKTLVFSIALVSFSAGLATAETSTLSADDWYENHYAILYKENPWDNAEQLGSMFDENLHHHQSDGAVVVAHGAEWIAALIADWQADGWLGSELADVEYDPLNATTAVFKAKWRDRYADGSVALECSWYLADLKNDSWFITQYADIDCAEHGL
jgi:hypothetical protein